MLVDSHCHLDYLERDGDLDEAVQRARDGVQFFRLAADFMGFRGRFDVVRPRFQSGFKNSIRIAGAIAHACFGEHFRFLFANDSSQLSFGDLH